MTNEYLCYMIELITAVFAQQYPVPERCVGNRTAGYGGYGADAPSGGTRLNARVVEIHKGAEREKRCAVAAAGQRHAN